MKVAVKQQSDKEIPTEVLADSIVAISQGMKKLRSGRLNDRALLLLVQDAAPMKLGMREIKAVFAGIENLESAFVKKRANDQKAKS